jgi:hypothetical protein
MDSSLRRDSPDINFRHSGWKATRARVHRVLSDLDVSAQRLARFSDCGHHAWIMQCVSDRTVYKIVSDKCHDRFCAPCSVERSRIIAHNVLEHVGKRALRFATLTLRSRDEPLATTCDRLSRSFARLRSRKLWKARVRGGVAFLEVTYSKTTGYWHAHLHLIIEGLYVPKALLKRLWHEITGDSYIVDIRIVRDNAKAARYVSKYVSKPLDGPALRSDKHLTEAIVALKSRRLCTTFGCWRGVNLTETPDDGEWIAVATLNSLLHHVRTGHAFAIEFLTAIVANNRTRSRAPPPPAAWSPWLPTRTKVDLQLYLFDVSNVEPP